MILGKNAKLLQVANQFSTKTSTAIATGSSYAENVITIFSLLFRTELEEIVVFSGVSYYVLFHNMR